MRAASTKSKGADTLAGIFEKNIKHAIKNGESFLPIYIKGFSDTHREYNKYVDMTFKMIRAIEEKYLGKADGETVKAYEEYADALFKSYMSQINTSKETLRGYLEMHHLFMKSCNDYWKKISDGYQKQPSTRSAKR